MSVVVCDGVPDAGVAGGGDGCHRVIPQHPAPALLRHRPRLEEEGQVLQLQGI